MGGWNSAMPGFKAETPSVPTTQSDASQDLIQSLVKTIASPISPELVMRASVPLAGEHVASVPSSIATPVSPYQERPLDQRQVTGRSAAKRQGIANAFTAAGNALGTIVTKEAQIKQNHIRDAAQKVILAQQGIDEAKIAHDQAVEAGDAVAASKYQEMIQKNQQARDAVFADPKMRKALQKGFNINYTDPSANKTEEHAAVQEAIKNAKSIQEKRELMRQQQEKQNQEAGSAMGAAFEKSMPQGMAANTLAQAQLAQVLADRKEAAATMKSVLPAIIRGDASVRVENIRSLTELQKQHDLFQQQEYNRQQTFINSIARLREASRLAVQRAWQEIPIEAAKTRQRLEIEGSDPTTVQKNAETSMRGWSSQIGAWTSRLNTAKQNLQLLSTQSGVTDEQKASAESEVRAAELGLEKAQAEGAYYRGIYKAKLSAVGLPDLAADLGLGDEDGNDGADDTSGESSSEPINQFHNWYTSFDARPTP